MKRIFLVLLMLSPFGVLYAQQAKTYIHKGNLLYQQQKYAEAEKNYRKSVEKSKHSETGNFNLGDAYYKQKKLDKAAEQFNALASGATNPAIKAGAYHNLGNTLLESKKLEESIEAYKKALMNNPKDDQTRYNLAYAMEKLKQQQQQDKNKDKNKDKKDQDKKDQKDKNKDQQKKDDKDKKDQNKDGKPDQDKKDGQGKEQPQPGKLSKEDAERMLDALNNEEKNTQDKLKNKKATGAKGRIVKDW